jgi:hypothetical protein
VARIAIEMAAARLKPVEGLRDGNR